RLKEGDKIDEGQLLARLDDRLARDDVAIAEAKLQVAEAEKRAAGKTKEEAQRRYESMVNTKMRVPGAVNQDDLQGALLTLNRYTEEEIAKDAALVVAKRQLESAKTILEMHKIRSPVKGAVKEILKRRGEAVRALETVVRIQIDENDK